MIPVTTFAGRRVAVFGLGASGNAAAKALLAGGAEVAAWDDMIASRDAAAKAGIALVDLATADWSGLAALILAPGVPLTHPEPHWSVLRARTFGVEVIGDIELFFRERAAHCPASPVIAITGTNGKSTTTALITHILRAAGLDAQMGGNIGQPILDLEPPAIDRFHVIEMSSFQIDLTPSLLPTVGVLLNLTPDHLDRHGPGDDAEQAMRNYVAIKGRLVCDAVSSVIGIDDDWCRAIIDNRIGQGAWTVSVAGQQADRPHHFFARGRRLHYASFGSPSAFVGDIGGIGTLRGRHNLQNALAALAVATLAVPQVEDWASHVTAMRSYPGLPHRMEEVGRLGHVVFINDSKATNANSTEKALASWDRDIFWIVGGKPKEGGIASLAPYLPRVAKAYLIGQAAAEFAATLDGHVAFERSGTLKNALAAAARDAGVSAGAGPVVVLLSPACASYDQFRSFEHRGDAFRRLVRELCGPVS